MTTKRKAHETMTSIDSATPIATDDVGGSEELDVVDMVANDTAETEIDPLATASAPENTAALFSRMGLTVNLNEVADNSEEACHNGAPAPIPTQQPGSTQQPAPSQQPDCSPMAEQISAAMGEDAEDAMVAEYMTRLLKRMRGDEPLPTSVATEASRAAGDATTDNSLADDTRATPSASTPSGGATKKTAHARTVRTPRKPRPDTVPETSCDWSAMRELANLSARGALDMHSRQRFVRDTFTKLLLAGLSLAAGISMAWNATVLGTYAWVGASVCWTITVVWAAQYYCLFRLCYRRSDRGGKNQSSSGDATVPQTAAADTAADTGSGN